MGWFAIRHIDQACASEVNVLQEIISLKCPPHAICMAQIITPWQVSKLDKVGRNPLCLAAANNSCCGRVLDSLIWDFPQAIQFCDQSGK